MRDRGIRSLTAPFAACALMAFDPSGLALARGASASPTAVTRDPAKDTALWAYLTNVKDAIYAATPGQTDIGPGSARVQFSIGANGQIQNLQIAATSEKHAQLARGIIVNLRLRPPPAGPVLLSQHFNFH